MALEPAVEEWFAANVSLVERLSRHVCRGARMNPADVDDFVSYVTLKLVENDYAVLRRFEGRCTIASFLIVVIRRALSDYQNHLRGKYRPSAEAQRLGAEAIELETLLRRDGKTLDEALQMMKASGHAMTLADAQRMAARFPERAPRPVLVELEDAPHADENIGAWERVSTSRTISAALRGAIGALGADDQTLLRLHFAAGWPVSAISRSMQIDQQRLYARLRGICKSLRNELVAAGIDRERINGLIGRTDADLDFGLEVDQTIAARPSSPTEDARLDQKQDRR